MMKPTIGFVRSTANVDDAARLPHGYRRCPDRVLEDSVAGSYRHVRVAALVKSPLLRCPCSGVINIDPCRAPYFLNRPHCLCEEYPLATKIAAVVVAGYPESLRQFARTVGQLAR